MKRQTARLGGILAFLALAVEVAPVWAGGMQLPTRGVRPTGRAGAFVAGANDLGALWFNPAGLIAPAAVADDKNQFLIDFGYVQQFVEYTRIDSGNNPRETVENSAPGLPIPTIAASWRLSDRLVIAGGIFAPYAGLARYPDDGPQRYSLIDLSETLLVTTEVAVAYRLTDRIRVGAGLQNMVFRLKSKLVFSGCPGQTVCAPEDPEFDSVAQLEDWDFFNPSLVVGAQWDIAEALRVGAALQLPQKVDGSGGFEAILPPSGFYNGAEIVGDRADVDFTIPAMVRVGVELDPGDRWKVEIATDIELWSQHEDFTITPEDVRIEGAPGVGTYELGPLELPRNYENTVAVQVGVEGQPLADMPLTLRGGFAVESRAAPDAYLSVLTMDGQKQLFGLGGSWGLGDYRIDATLAYVAVEDRTVTPEEARSPLLTPIRDESDEPLEVFVNAGDYSSSWIIAGVGLAGTF